MNPPPKRVIFFHSPGASGETDNFIISKRAPPILQLRSRTARGRHPYYASGRGQHADFHWRYDIIGRPFSCSGHVERAGGGGRSSSHFGSVDSSGGLSGGHRSTLDLRLPARRSMDENPAGRPRRWPGAGRSRRMVHRCASVWMEAHQFSRSQALKPAFFIPQFGTIRRAAAPRLHCPLDTFPTRYRVGSVDSARRGGL